MMNARNYRPIIETENPSMMPGGGTHARAAARQVHASGTIVDPCYLNPQEHRDYQRKALWQRNEKVSPHCLTREAINT